MSATLDEVKGLLEKQNEDITTNIERATVIEEMLADFQQRLDAVEGGEHGLTDEALESIKTAMIDDVMNNPDSEFVRRIRFEDASDRGLVGSKYARWNLNVGDIEWLHDVQESLRGQRKVSGGGVYRGPSEELTKAFDALSDAYYLSEDESREIDRKAVDEFYSGRIPKSRLGRLWAGAKDDPVYKEYRRAMDSAESGYGSQLIGAQYVGDLWEAARSQSRIMALIPEFEMTAPTAYLPVEADLPELMFVSESTANNSANYSTTKTGSNRVQVDAKKFVMHQMWSGEMEEDSIIPFVPFLRRQGTLALAHYTDSLVLNGDTTNAATGNINLDDADPDDTKHYLAFDGLRHIGLVDNTNNQLDASGAATFADFWDLTVDMVDRTYLMDWGHPTDPMDLVFVGSPEDGDALVTLTEFVTVDLYGDRAGVLTGQIGNIGRHPFITSIAMSLTEADGKVSTTAGNNTLGQIVAFNRRAFNWGWRRRVRLETERIPATDQTRLVYSLRAGFGRYSATGAASGIEAASVLFNITV